MTPDPRAALARLVERTANLLAATSGERDALGVTWDTTAVEVEAARVLLAQPPAADPVRDAAERLVRAHSPGCDSGGCGCGEQERPAGEQGQVGRAFDSLRAALADAGPPETPEARAGLDRARASDRAEYECERADRLRDAADDARVDEARGK